MTEQVATKELTHSERFMNKVFAEFGSSVGGIEVTRFQGRLVQNYFVSLDASLKTAEEKRLKKPEKYREELAYTWSNLNLEKLARDVVTAARVGFDPSQANHINLIPFKNNNTNKYDIAFIEGYRGIEMKAKKYGLEIPDHVEVQLVYSKDEFKSVKKDLDHQYEGYTFNIVNDFDRGEIVGGFYYHLYSHASDKNRLVVMPLKEILKRKPDKAAPEFWGGEKDKWGKDDKGKNVVVGKETVEGWYDQMCYKTIYRAAYNDITIDSQKIDEDYLRLRQMESDFVASGIDNEINENANREPIDITPTSATTSDPVTTTTEEPDTAEPVAETVADPTASKETPKGKKSINDMDLQDEMEFGAEPVGAGVQKEF